MKDMRNFYRENEAQLKPVETLEKDCLYAVKTNELWARALFSEFDETGDVSCINTLHNSGEIDFKIIFLSRQILKWWMMATLKLFHPQLFTHSSVVLASFLAKPLDVFSMAWNT
jgi:hypothetical protein